MVMPRANVDDDMIINDGDDYNGDNGGDGDDDGG